MKRTAILIMTMLMVIVCAIGVAACVPDDDNGKDYTVTVLCGDGGTYTLSEPSPVPENIDETLTVTPDQGYEINEVTYNGAKIVLTKENTYTFNVTEDATITISFKKTNSEEPPEEVTKYTVSVDCNKENGDYEITHSGEVEENTEVTLTLKPNENYKAEVKVNGEVVDLTDNKYTFTVDKDIAIAITFKEINSEEPPEEVTKYNVTVNCDDENGDYEITAEGEVEKDTEVTLTLKPNENYEAEVTVNGVVVEITDNTYTFTVTADTTIVITFKATEAQEPSDRHEHTYGEWTITTKPTDVYGGTAERTCSDPNCTIETEGHTEELELPVITDEAYTIADNTATCNNKGMGKYSITIGDYTFTFEQETFALEHDYSNGATKCTRCGHEKGKIEDIFVGVWKTDTLPERTLEVTADSIKLNDVASSGEIVSERTDAGERMMSLKFGELNYTIVAHELKCGNTSYYSLNVSYKHPTTHIPVGSAYYKEDYPVKFPDEINGYWLAGSYEISIFGRTLGFVGETVDIDSYTPQSNGSFVLTFESRDDLLSGPYSLRYTKATNKLEFIYTDYSKGTPRDVAIECEIDSEAEENLVQSGHEGTYVSDDGEYTVEIDAEGHLIFNGSRMKLDGGKFIYDNCVFQFVFMSGGVRLSCPALGIEGILLKKVENK